MNIIPVIEQFLTEIFTAAGDFMENPNDLCGLEEKIDRAGRNSNAKIMELILNESDKMICDSHSRRKKYTIQRHDKRTLITTFGDITFDHTYYRSRKDGSYHYLLDEQMCLPRDEHFSDHAEACLLKEAAKSSYQKAADLIKSEEQTISKVTVMNKVHGILEELPIPEPEEKKKCEFLYIEADEDHIHRQSPNAGKKGDCILGKLVYIYERKEEVCKGKTRLVNPVYFGGQYQGSEGNAALWKRIDEYIEKNYDTDFLERVYISGDGASWIKAGTEYIGKSVLVADRYHLMKYINAAANQMLDESCSVKADFYRYIKKNKPEEITELCSRMREAANNTEPIDACETYLLNNWPAIRRAFQDKNVYGCSAEGHVSSVYSDRMSSRPMGWSETGADHMCRLRCLTKTYGEGKIVELVQVRREKEFSRRAATGTDGIGISVEDVRKKYTKQQKETAVYAERMHATLGGTLAQKQLAIRYHLSGI